MAMAGALEVIASLPNEGEGSASSVKEVDSKSSSHGAITHHFKITKTVTIEGEEDDKIDDEKEKDKKKSSSCSCFGGLKKK